MRWKKELWMNKLKEKLMDYSGAGAYFSLGNNWKELMPPVEKKNISLSKNG